MISLIFEAVLRSLILGVLVWVATKALRVRDPRLERNVWLVTLAAACAAVVVATESKNVRSYMWRIVKGIAKSVEDLPAYPEVRQQFENIIAHHFKNSAAGFDEMLAYALHRIRKWKEPRPKRATTKRKSS